MAPYVFLAIAGILSHVFYFRHGEHHVYSHIYLVLFVVSSIIVSIFFHYSYILVYLAGLYISLLVYRLLLHPLHSFPGPVLARISSLWSISPKHKTHLTLQALHNQYGPIVRTGPSDLSIIHPSAVPAIYGPQSPCTKAAWYDLAYPARPLQNCRNLKEHNARRRTWSPAFSDKMIRGYEQRIGIYQQQLIAKLTTLQSVDVRKWLYLYSFDVMGDLSFGRGFDCLKTGREHWAITLLKATMEQVGLFLPPWLLLILLRIPPLMGNWLRFLAFCSEALQTRMRMKDQVQNPDISASLLAPLNGREPTLAERSMLDGDARLIIVAGSDSTALTLCAILYELVRHPEQIARLREEVEPFVGKGEVLGSDIALLDHLNGVINEALRMYPVVPGALWRKTPAEGIQVEGVHIPGEMTVSCPQYVMGRSELCYAQPDEFIPERWYKYPDLIKHRSAFAPFSLGPYNCIGRPLALLNLRTTLVKLITTFDVGFALGEDGRAFVQQAQDNFVLVLREILLLPSSINLFQSTYIFFFIIKGIRDGNDKDSLLLPSAVFIQTKNKRVGRIPELFELLAVVVHWRRRALNKQHTEGWGMATDGHDFYFLRVDDQGQATSTRGISCGSGRLHSSRCPASSSSARPSSSHYGSSVCGSARYYMPCACCGSSHFFKSSAYGPSSTKSSSAN
ncbi:hypothetical protein CNMCM5793_003904 [Aspergillus hiratsukae]|uniref:Tryprostatin B 6-hydroxylase n=1 Tax=Aspergillus hiratsukae TaxID=1194566 RepID=A0A8H6QDP1_9EURO|nr:hypothetical protein CNMCM5793_003904 [Aspergillus hiratsukae]KAF7171765.1 hypothetical protein CNMCM6106_006147 [Aspergillus hiratsukae]